MSFPPDSWLAKAATVVVAVLVVSACGGSDDKGDPEAFCELLLEGVGRADGDVDPSEFIALAEVAPPSVAPAVEQLGITAADVETLDHTDLEALFDASFDPDSTEARRELEAYAVEECDIPVDQDRVETDVGEFLAINFGEAGWLDEIDVSVTTTESGIVAGIDVEFQARPLTGDSVEACRALAVYLYEVAGSEGPVRVNFDEKLLVSRESREATCQRP